ncbi:hypothetical protein SAMN05421819_2083 [Bryocella elongata]|uniref:Uncharacterized protein n=1 Tax=Bryocella elongata TaxID=863522 RepID=A0A1H5Y3C5_9BACT|nr:hypothetical protein SAMN05421819_2083 [Bryocella elongata]
MLDVKIPAFANEADEAAWWDSNRDLVSEEFALAAREGRLLRRSDSSTPSAEVPGLCLSDDELLKVHDAARRRRITFLEYVRLAVHEALDREPAA